MICDARSSPGSAVNRVEDAYARIAEADRPEVWITLRPAGEALADAAEVDARAEAGECLPLAGATLAVKDNIDVAGLPTTAACRAYAYDPRRSAPAVTRLVDAGAVVLGKTNLDQFATGLTGTRSPYGAVRDAHRPAYASGGSSSGSAVAVALGIADLALATDTAGSARVPAAFQGIVGIKPTRGLVSVRGVVPACRSFDCVSLFTRTLPEGALAFSLIVAPDASDPLSRRWPLDAPLGATPQPRVAMPEPRALNPLTPAARAAFTAACARLADAGAQLLTVDIEPFLEAGRLLYGGAFVAERYASVGAFAEANPAALDPQVAEILRSAGTLEAHRLVADTERLDELRVRAREALAETDALLLPTAPRQPTLEEVAADPVASNSALGVFTTATNLLDLCAVSVPAGEADGGSFGVTVLAPAFADRLCADVAFMLNSDTAPDRSLLLTRAPGSPRALSLLVVGAHLSGQPLNHELTSLGAVLEGLVETAPDYRLYRLQTDPPKPGLVRVARGGAKVTGELWALAPAALGEFLAALPPPMALARVVLADGREVIGFTCEAGALDVAQDITEYGGWVAYRAGAKS